MTPSTAATVAAGASVATAAEQAAALSPVVAVKSGSGDSEEGEEVNLFTDPSHVAADSKKPCLDDFSMLRVLGKGSYGKVVLVRKKSTQVLYAMKVLKKGDVVRKRQVERTKIERRVLGHIDHPFLMKLHFAFQTGNKLYLVLDYCPGGELFFHLSRYKRFPEGVVRFYAAQLVCALKHLHDGGIIYRDIKPENILLDAEGHVKLGDFGLAKDNVTEAAFGAHSVCGTPEYMAPEVINKAGHGTAVDWWGLGMLMYEMLTGLPPWYTKDRQKLFERLRGAPLIMPKGISPPAASIIQGLLTRNPAKRLGALGGQQIMGHEFFRGLDWDALLSKRIPAPLNPCRSHGPGSESTHNFDPQFTRLPIDTVAQPGAVAALGSPGGDLNFDGFTYDDPCALYAGGAMRT
ncbi:kinase-like domain-containing protein [Tribonema minus]|uniref:Kinase-like domain-containing protein n=1 Tax=Tribonema minus TaxID=303371 RepID=A0A836CFL2_9STRA|nr:kinase-like domain-containing protein [Tribonema minus]